VPPIIGIVLGEACYNLRSSLDYLVFALAHLDSGVEESGTQFPIENSRKGFEWRQKRGWLNGVNAAHVAIIDGLQPYRGCQWTAALRDVSNRDKHREFAKIDGQIAITTNSPDLPTTFIIETPEPSGGKMQMKIAISVQILFRDGTPVAETLEKIKAGVAETLEALKPEFDR
jgi:hypothetical protein